MTVEQEIRAEALKAAAVVMGADPQGWAAEQFEDLIRHYENYIQHGKWSA